MLVVSDTGMIIVDEREGPTKDHKKTKEVVLFITVGVGLFNCVSGVRSAPANGKCTK